MPFQRNWIPSPGAEQLEVHSTLPEGFREDESPPPRWGRPRLAHTAEYREMYYCPGGPVHPPGWIEGEPEENRVDDMAMLSGRRGTTYNCRKCGQELGFVGMVS